MLDHLFLDTVGALRAALDQSLLEPAGQDDRLVYDLLTGDLVWETTVSLPGDGDPPRVSADISLDWQTWSQSAWRSMSMGEQVEEPPEIGIEVVFRVQRLATPAGAGRRPGRAARGEPGHRRRQPGPFGPGDRGGLRGRKAPPEVAVEVAYEGSYRLPAPSERSDGQRDEPFPRAGRVVAERGATPSSSRSGATRQVSAATEATFSSLGSWVASTTGPSGRPRARVPPAGRT